SAEAPTLQVGDRVRITDNGTAVGNWIGLEAEVVDLRPGDQVDLRLALGARPDGHTGNFWWSRSRLEKVGVVTHEAPQGRLDGDIAVPATVDGLTAEEWKSKFQEGWTALMHEARERGWERYAREVADAIGLDANLDGPRNMRVVFTVPVRPSTFGASGRPTRVSAEMALQGSIPGLDMAEIRVIEADWSE